MGVYDPGFDPGEELGQMDHDELLEEVIKLRAKIQHNKEVADQLMKNFQAACIERDKVELQLSEAKDTIMAEAMRAKMLNTVHQVALRQNTAMLELADHYTGSLWPEEVQRAAKEILKAAKAATSEKPKDEPVLLCRAASYDTASRGIIPCPDRMPCAKHKPCGVCGRPTGGCCTVAVTEKRVDPPRKSGCYVDGKQVDHEWVKGDVFTECRLCNCINMDV